MSQAPQTPTQTESAPQKRYVPLRPTPADVDWQFVYPMLDSRNGGGMDLLGSLETSDGVGHWGGINWARSLPSQVRQREVAEPTIKFGKSSQRTQPSSFDFAQCPSSLNESESELRSVILCHLRDNLPIELLQRRLLGLQLSESRHQGVPPVGFGANLTVESTSSRGDTEPGLPLEKSSSILTGAVEDLLIEAILDRWIIAANNQRQYQAAADPQDLKENYIWWSFTQRFAEQFYWIVTARLIDLKRFFIALKARRIQLWRESDAILRGIPAELHDPVLTPIEHIHKGRIAMAFLDNTLIYALHQVTTTEDIRRLFLLDGSSTENGGWQPPLASKDTVDLTGEISYNITSLYNSFQVDPQSGLQFSLRDDAFHSMLSKLRQSNLPRDSPHSLKRGEVSKRFEEFVQRPGVDMLQLSVQDTETICLYSLFDFRPPAVLLLKFCGLHLSDNILTTFPWLATAQKNWIKTLKQLCLPSHLIACLSVRTKVVMIEFLDREVILASKPTIPVDVATLELYSRLLTFSTYMVPVMLPQKVIHTFYTLRNSPSATLHQWNTMLQLVNWRLLRPFLAHGLPHKLLYELLSCFNEGAAAAIFLDKNSQIFEQFQTLIMKLSLQLTAVPALAADTRLELPESVIRVLIYGLARLYKVKGFRDLSALKDLKNLISRCLETTRWRPPQSSMNAFPDRIREMIQQVPQSSHEVSRKLRYNFEQLLTEAQNQLSAGTTAPQQSKIQETLIANLKSNEDTQIQLPLLCWLWAHAVATKKAQPSRTVQVTSALDHVHFAEILNTIPARQLVKGTYYMFDFLLRESAITDLMPDLISRLIYHHGLLRIDNVILALVDGLANERAQSLLNYLLFVDPNLKSLVFEWCSTPGNGPNHWNIDDSSIVQNFCQQRCPQAVPRKDAFAPNANQTPMVYPWDIDALLPVFEVLLCRCIEEGQSEFISKFVQEYGRLFAYHATPMGAIRDLLFQYYSLTDPYIRVTIARILTADVAAIPMVELEEYRQFLDAPSFPDGTLNLEPLNARFVTRALELLQQVATTVTDNFAFSQFEEGGGATSIQSIVNSFTLQLMVCGMHSYWKIEFDSLCYMREIAVLVSRLPQEFERIGRDWIEQFIPLNIDWISPLVSAWLWNMPTTRLLLPSPTTSSLYPESVAIQDDGSAEYQLPSALIVLTTANFKSFKDLRQIMKALTSIIPRLYHERSLFEALVLDIVRMLARCNGLVLNLYSTLDDSYDESKCLQECCAALNAIFSCFSLSPKATAAVRVLAVSLQEEIQDLIQWP